MADRSRRAVWTAGAAGLGAGVACFLAVQVLGIVLRRGFGVDVHSEPYTSWWWVLAAAVPVGLMFYVERRVKGHLRRKWKLPPPGSDCRC